MASHSSVKSVLSAANPSRSNRELLLILFHDIHNHVRTLNRCHSSHKRRTINFQTLFMKNNLENLYAIKIYFDTSI